MKQMPRATPPRSALMASAAWRPPRRWLDRALALMARLAAFSMLLLLLAIVGFLLWHVLPIWKPLQVTPVQQQSLQHWQPARVLQMATDPYQQVLWQLQDTGQLSVHQLKDGQRLSSHALSEQPLQAWHRHNDHLLLRDRGQQLSLWQLQFQWVSLSGGPGLRPRLTLIDRQTLVMDQPELLQHWRVGQQSLLAWRQQGQVWAAALMDGEWQAQPLVSEDDWQVQQIIWHPNQPWLLASDAQGRLHIWHYQQAKWRYQGHQALLPDGQLLAWQWLAGAASLMALDDQQRLWHWHWSPGQLAATGQPLTHARVRTLHQNADSLHPEQDRRGYLLQQQQQLQWYYPSARRALGSWALPDKTHAWHLGPLNDQLWVLDTAGQLSQYAVDNAHPELSWSALWLPQWYEGRQQPDWVWQSSASSDDFEPKYSLLPLTIGTLKAALYALVIAIPLAVLAALYCAHFLPSSSRAWAKPSVEMMEALPTVILGFLAGLWLAPWLEQHLASFFALILLLPLSLGLLMALAWRWPLLSAWLRRWPMAIMTLWLLLMLSQVFWLAPLAEQRLFAGHLPLWLNQQGFDFDQRNALVVGIAMGFAVIPTIFSMAEDAIFSVPKPLSDGALALGLSSWQALWFVVLPTASPGIFSAIMLGLGRALGETMILLMATGNNAILSLSPFTGMRSVSASLAIELPEAVPGSSHYRVLLLAALLLIGLTLLFNSLAEAIRQRLKRRYAGLNG